MPDVRTVISDICARAGLDPDTDIDVSILIGSNGLMTILAVALVMSFCAKWLSV